MCVDRERQLASIKLSYEDTSTKELISLVRASPRTLDCKTELLQNDGVISKVRVFRNDERIRGIALFYSESKVVERIGAAFPQYDDFDF